MEKKEYKTPISEMINVTTSHLVMASGGDQVDPSGITVDDIDELED